MHGSRPLALATPSAPHTSAGWFSRVGTRIRAAAKWLTSEANRLLDAFADRIIPALRSARAPSFEVLLWTTMAVILLVYLIILAIEPNAGR